MRVGFIFPSSDYLYDPFRGDPHTHFQILTVIEQRFNGNAELFLIDLIGVARDSAKYHIQDCDVYLYSLYTLDFEELAGLVNMLRERFPEAVHVTGGPHAVLFQEQTLEVFDSLIIGEGEEIIINMLVDVALRRDVKPRYVETRRMDINAYPYPKRKWMAETAVARKGLMKTKKNPEYGELLSTTVMFSRDCPYSCAFCAIGQYSGGVRYRHPHLVEQEINYLKRDYGIQGISMLDEIVVPLSRDKAIPYLEAIGRTDIKWRGQTRVDMMTEELAALMRETGCVSMSLGVESASQTCLDIVNKKIDVEQSKRTIKMLKEAGIECRVYMMSGMPGEPDDIVARTLEFLWETQPDVVTMSMFTVRPGTAIWQNPEKFGIKSVTTDWQNMMNLQARYEDEKPKLSFEYEEGKGFSTERIVENFLEVQGKLKEWGMSSAIFAKEEVC